MIAGTETGQRRTSRGPTRPPVRTARLPRQHPFSFGLSIIGLCAVFLGVIQIAVAGSNADMHAVIVLYTVAFWVWIAAGLLAWWRRPSNSIGPLVACGGIALFLGGVGNFNIPALGVVGQVFATSVLAVTVHLLLAFPTGRLHGAAPLTAVICGYAVCFLLQAPLYLLGPEQLVLRDASVSVQRAAGTGVMVLASAILLGRLRRADPAHRRVLLPLFGFGVLAVLFVPMSAILLAPLLRLEPVALTVLQLVVLSGLPVALTVGMLRGGFARTGELAELGVWLGAADGTKPALESVLAETLGDPSLRIVYWLDESSEFVDESGAAIAPPSDQTPVFSRSRRLTAAVDNAQAWMLIELETRLVGAIIYDSRLIGDDGLVKRAGQVVAIAVDRDRLIAELWAARRALLDSRRRLVDTADGERSRIAHDLHDGLQVTLVLLALEAQQIANAPEASATTNRQSTQLRERIDAAAADLRRLVHNVLPAALIEQGLSAAIEDLVDRLPIASQLELHLHDDMITLATANTAYFVVAEALANTVKHSESDRVVVRLEHTAGDLSMHLSDNGIGGASLSAGTGLRGLADRVDVLGGSFHLSSPAGRGTTLEVVLPCA